MADSLSQGQENRGKFDAKSVFFAKLLKILLYYNSTPAGGNRCVWFCLRAGR
jgi:hypothetical protein